MRASPEVVMAGADATGVVRNRPAPKPAPELPPRHVIGEYTHRSRVVRCECGWLGSSLSQDGKPSAWQRHVAEFKLVKR